MTLYADANSSYDAKHAIRIGRLMEEYGFGFYEEPCPFDDLWATKAVADALRLPVAGGEQEFSLRRFQWAIEARGLDIRQPDLSAISALRRNYRARRILATRDVFPLRAVRRGVRTVSAVFAVP